MTKHTSRQMTAEEVVMAKIERYAQKHKVDIADVDHHWLWGCYLKKKHFKKQAQRKAMRRRASGGAF